MTRAEFTRTAPELNFVPVEMPDGLDWLMRPVGAMWCKYESLIDGTLDIADIARMNDALDIRAENEWRAHRANQ